MGIGAVEAKGADAGNVRGICGLNTVPGNGGGGKDEGMGMPIDVGIGGGQVEVGGDVILLEDEGGFDQPRDASGSF